MFEDEAMHSGVERWRREERLPAPELPDILGDPRPCSDKAGAGNDHERALNAVYLDGIDCAAVLAAGGLDSCKHRVECTRRTDTNL